MTNHEFKKGDRIHVTIEGIAAEDSTRGLWLRSENGTAYGMPSEVAGITTTVDRVEEDLTDLLPEPEPKPKTIFQVLDDTDIKLGQWFEVISDPPVYDESTGNPKTRELCFLGGTYQHDYALAFVGGQSTTANKMTENGWVFFRMMPNGPLDDWDQGTIDEKPKPLAPIATWGETGIGISHDPITSVTSQFIDGIRDSKYPGRPIADNPQA